MSKIYLDIPNMQALAERLTESYRVSDSLIDADVIIAEKPILFLKNKLIITISDTPPEQPSVFINKTLGDAVIFESIRSAVSAWVISTKSIKQQTVYHVLRGNDPKVEYLVKKLESILNAAAESIVEIDLFGNILFYNKKFAETYDKGSELFEENIFDMLDDATTDKLRLIIESTDARVSSEFTGLLLKPNGQSIPIEGHITILPEDTAHYEIIFDDVTTKLKKQKETRKIEEQAIVSGLSRHLSHNVMNALTAAGGFIRQIKTKTDNNLHMQNLWHIIDGKLMLIEEVVAGYNDYTHAITMRTNDKVELSSFFQELILTIAEKKIDKNFSAYLYKFVDNYNLTYDFSKASPCTIDGNKMFLKLALCYILKDNIRYFDLKEPLNCRITIETIDTFFIMKIAILNIDISEKVLDTMFRPWNHQMLSQSFDYWGVVIASTILERHGGSIVTKRIDNGAELILYFNKISGGVK